MKNIRLYTASKYNGSKRYSTIPILDPKSPPEFVK